MNPVIHFVAGLPRSGSTLLQNLLGQNPRHHVTPTNGLISMMLNVSGSWDRTSAFQAQGLQKMKPRVAAMLRGMAYGFYEHELSSGKVVFDKSRGWLAHIEMLEEVFRRPVKVVCTVRDVKAVVASFEKLHRKNPMLRRHNLGPNFTQVQTIEGRAKALLGPGGIVGLPVNFIRDALNRGVQDRVLILPYRNLTSDPHKALSDLHVALGLPEFVYDPRNVEQITQEDDAVFGWDFDLHTIRKEVEPPQDAPWEGVLPPHVCAWIDREFADINALARGT